MTAITIRAVDRLCHDEAGQRAAYLAAQVLIENRWHNWPAPGWDQPAILAFVGADCVAGANFNRDDVQQTVLIEFAWCDRQHPRALAVVLAALRQKLREQPTRRVRFACHPDNAPMLKLTRLLGLTPSSVSFRMPGERLAQ
jgi:hypothetical protein